MPTGDDPLLHEDPRPLLCPLFGSCGSSLPVAKSAPLELFCRRSHRPFVVRSVWHPRLKLYAYLPLLLSMEEEVFCGNPLAVWTLYGFFLRALNDLSNRVAFSL